MKRQDGRWYTRVYLAMVQQLVVLFLVLAGLVFLVGISVRYGGVFSGSILGTVLLDFYIPVSTNLAGITVTIFLVEDLYRRHSTREKKRELVLQMGSPDRAIALDAVRKLVALGWLADGTLERAVLVRANLGAATLVGADLRLCNLEQADLSGADLRGANLAGANLRGVNLAGADLTQADLTGVDLVYANLRNASLIACKLENAGLLHAHLEDARLISADLRQADLSGAHLDGAFLQEANLDEADLRGVVLETVDLTRILGRPIFPVKTEALAYRGGVSGKQEVSRSEA